MQEIYVFLNENYVEDDDGNFRFDYSIGFLRWAFSPSTKHPAFVIGIKDKTTASLVGFITGIIIDMVANKAHFKATEVNFLCVHKKHRSLNFAPLLIKEVTRRSNLIGTFQGMYTSGTLLPTPFCQTRYYHRNLNPEKLLNIKFAYLPPTMTKKMYLKLFYIPDENTVKGFTKMKKEDVKAVRGLLEEYLSKFEVYQEWSKKEVEHFFLQRDNIIDTYVLKKNGKVTDFFSFYCLPSSILKNPKYKTLKAAYNYYYVNTTLSVEDLFENAIITAKQNDYDVYNALDLMDNKQSFEKLKFVKGDGFLQYYLYNWKVENGYIKPEQLALVLF